MVAPVYPGQERSFLSNVISTQPETPASAEIKLSNESWVEVRPQDIPSEVAYYCGYQDYGYTVAFRVYNNKVMGDDSHYSPWVPLEDLVGKDFIFIDEKRNPDGYNTPLSYWEQKIRPYFERTEEPIVFIERRNGRDFRTFYIFKCYGFKGPDKQMDVKLPLPSSLLRLSSSIALKNSRPISVARPA